MYTSGGSGMVAQWVILARACVYEYVFACSSVCVCMCVCLTLKMVSQWWVSRESIEPTRGPAQYNTRPIQWLGVGEKTTPTNARTKGYMYIMYNTIYMFRFLRNHLCYIYLWTICICKWEIYSKSVQNASNPINTPRTYAY